ncbi:MAG TPA: Smr/MutS family protein [Gammaproteobacteria bacterium]|nr:Smr/MutS family protein [Gammaproteobacteria bacterium]
MTDDTDEAAVLFARAARGARPLKSQRAWPERPRAEPRARFARIDRAQVLVESLHGTADQPGPGDELLFHRPQVSRRVLQRLRRGHYSVAAEIDLHGLRARDAQAALGTFLEHSVARGYPCVRVVHGKGRRSGRGGPVLKAGVDGWLRRRDEVLAFASARPVDGGTGAVYVLLRGGR